MVVKYGVTRIVFVFKNIVIKIPNFTHKFSHFLRGLIGNISEGQTWRWNSGRYETGRSYLLCPVVWCSFGGWILIMRKANVLDSKEWDTEEHRRYFAGDDTTSNYGIYNNKLVKIDYADLDNHWGEDFKK